MRSYADALLQCLCAFVHRWHKFRIMYKCSIPYMCVFSLCVHSFFATEVLYPAPPLTPPPLRIVPTRVCVCVHACTRMRGKC